MADDQFDAGMKMRRQVHGAQHVDAAWDRAQADPHEKALQTFVTEAAWGMQWTRDTLPPRDRSLLVIAFLTALGRDHELLVHARSAMLRTGCRPEEVKEVVLMAAAYCGIPAAVDAMRVVRQAEAEVLGSKGT